MSKFKRIAQYSNFPGLPAAPTTQGLLPTDLSMPTPVAPQQAPAPTPQIAKPVAPQANNFFIKAGVDPRQYVGTAEQNEKLRQVLDPSARTFYDAYVKHFGAWAQHPSERIQKLNGGVVQPAPKPQIPNIPTLPTGQFPSFNAPTGIDEFMKNIRQQ